MASGRSRSSANGSGGFLKFFLGFVFAFVVLLAEVAVLHKFFAPAKEKRSA